MLLYKKADPKLFGNYRPIALLNSIYQLINIIITERAQKLTERHCVLQAGQYGFRWHRGVSMSAQRLHWLLKQARIKGGILIQINLDYRNAFNAAGHAQLWAVLEKLGVPDLDLIKAMYEQASMSITVEGKSSAQVKMDCGTAQGSTLSPLLFNLFIMLSCVSSRHRALATASSESGTSTTWPLRTTSACWSNARLTRKSSSVLYAISRNGVASP